MGGEKLMEAWFGNLWRTSRKTVSSEPEKPVIGILSLEVASLMLKVIHLWQCLSDNQMFQLREETAKSLGIQKLISDDGDYLMDLALAEIIENFICMVKSVARLGRKCRDPAFHHLEHIFDDLVTINVNWGGWDYKWKKMERKVKKMERFVAVAAQLYQEIEVLTDLEYNLMRIQVNVDNLGTVKLLDIQQKVMWQRQEVKNLREMSPWVRTYDYTVHLLLRSLFTIISRIKLVFGINQTSAIEGSNDSELVNNNRFVRSLSFSALMHTTVYPSENNLSRLYSAPIGRSVSNLGLTSSKTRMHSKKLTTHYECKKKPEAKTRRWSHVGPFKGCMIGRNDSPVLQSCMPTSNDSLRSNSTMESDIKVSVFSSRHKFLNALPSTLGESALALHYANVIVLIEKLASSPHLISLEARDDLYNMLPTSVKTSLRVKLKLFAKTLGSSIYDAALGAEWSSILTTMLEWMAPLAHNMVRWHSERNFEKQRMISGTNVLLVQTLYFANQAKTEAAITELLLGLNYISRFGKKINDTAFFGSTYSKTLDDYMLHKDNMV